MASIKKHKIKVFSDDTSSDFVVDLRGEKEVENTNKDKSSKSLFSNNFKKDREKSFKKITIKINEKKIKNNFFYPLYLLIFKIVKSIFMFFYDWLIDIVNFFLKKRKVKKNKFRISIKPLTKLSFKIPSFSFKFKKKDKEKRYNNVSFNYIKSKQLRLFNKRKSFNKKKSVFIFFIILIFIATSFKIVNYYNLYKSGDFEDKISGYSMSGIENLSSATEAITVFDFYNAYTKFSEAGDNFRLIEEELKRADELLLFLSIFSKDDKVKMFSQSKNISNLGFHLSSFGNNLSVSFSYLFSFFEGDNQKEDYAIFSSHIEKASKDLKLAKSSFYDIKSSAIPSEHKELFNSLKVVFNEVELGFSYFADNLNLFREFLGIDSDKRYLLVFQNNSEIRASGGFIGSYALVDVKNGKISNIEIPAGGSYDTEGGMSVLVEPPKPLQLVKPVWYFWDSNWWPDWKVSAENISWFYEKSGGPSVDGVIAFTPEILEDLLRVLGEIDFSDKYGVVINADNFQDIVQEVVEVIGNPDLYPEDDLSVSSNLNLDDFEQNKPKEIIGEIFEVLMERLVNEMNVEKTVSLFDLFIGNLNKKNILLYFKDQRLQSMAEEKSWAGRVKETKCDYLMIVDSNIAGAKSDKFLNKNYYLESEIQEDGRIINKLTIERNRVDESWGVFSSVRNVNWLRVYVPLGSRLIKAQGFSTPDSKYFKTSDLDLRKNDLVQKWEGVSEIDLSSGLRIYQEMDKTVFANWTMTDISMVSKIEIEYELPHLIKVDNSDTSFIDKLLSRDNSKLTGHCLLWQKQAGLKNSTVNFNVVNNYPAEIVWSYPSSLEVDGYQDSFVYDKYFNFLLK